MADVINTHRTTEAPTAFDESWFEPDLDLASERYFASKRSNSIRGLVVAGLLLLICGGLFFLGLHGGILWPLGILLSVVAFIGGLIALALWGAAGTELAFHMKDRSKTRSQHRARDSRQQLLEVLRNRSPFILYLRNFEIEESTPTFTGDDFVPVDIHAPRFDSRLEDFALSPVPRAVAIFTIGFYGRLERSPRVHEVFLTDESWASAIEHLARRASAIITVVDQATEGVQRECLTLAALAAREHAPPIWMLLDTSMEDQPWAKILADSARWLTPYRGVPSGEAPPILAGLPRDELG